MSATIQNIAFDYCPWMRERNQMWDMLHLAGHFIANIKLTMIKQRLS